MRADRQAIRVFAGDAAAASAVEFALVLPVFLMVLFGIVSYGAYFAVVHGVHQIAAEAARASVGGLSEQERVQLAQRNIEANVDAYPLISPGRLRLEAASTESATSVFKVTVSYDASDMFIFSLPTIVPLPSGKIVRSAAIQRGGY